MRIALAVVLVVWFAAAVALGARGSLATVPAPAAVVVLTLAACALAFAIAPWRHAALALDQRFLAAFHAWRAWPGVAFLFAVRDGILPAGFAGTAGVGDCIVAVAAIAAASVAGAAPGCRRRVLLLFHAFGFADLALVLARGAQAFLAGDERMAVMTRLPWALLPLWAVPITLTLHVVALVALLRRGGASTACAVDAPR